jgi:hypothetical protein
MYPNEFAARKVKTHLKCSHCSVFFSRASNSFTLHIKHQILLFRNWKPPPITESTWQNFQITFSGNKKKKRHHRKEIIIHTVEWWTEHKDWIYLVLPLPIVVASRSHSDTPHSVWLLQMGDQPDRPDNTQHSRQTNIHVVAKFKPTAATEQPQTHALDLAATGRIYLVFLVNPT